MFGRFELNYCSGHCTYPFAPEAAGTFHSEILSLTVQNGLMNQGDSSSLPAPCCVAMDYSAVSFVSFEHNSVFVIRTYENMRAKKCGCR